MRLPMTLERDESGDPRPDAPAVRGLRMGGPQARGLLAVSFSRQANGWDSTMIAGGEP